MTPWKADPLRAHGAWVDLFVTIAAGALVAAGGGLEAALLAGTGFAGAFLVAATLSRKRADSPLHRRRLLVGAGLALGGPAAALSLGAPATFLAVHVLAALPGGIALLAARRGGLLAPTALVAGLAALSLAGPAAALAGGASPLAAGLLFALLWPFHTWRSLRLAAELPAPPWNRAQLRRRGLREAAVAAGWGLCVALALGFA